MLDLSFLTQEEQEAIMKVLQRDAELKRTEEERVRHLPEKVKDAVQLKNMSGQWFYEAKSKRHRDKIHGADIIRASMQRKPATRAEMSQNKPSKAKNSWVSNVNKEVFVPPELHGIGEHQEQQLKFNSSSKIASLLAKPEETHMKTAVSSVKQRRNPFNSTASGDNLNSEESENRAVTQPQLSKKEVLSLSEESQPKLNLQNDETEKHTKPSVEATDESQKGLIKRPVPKARKLIHKATDPVSQSEVVPKPAKWTEKINGAGTPPRGILKRSSSSSSTDSEARVSQMLDVQKKNGLPTATIFEGEAEKNSLTEEAEDSTQSSLEKLKQVRFSCSIGKGEPLQGPRVYHSREKAEFELLETDKIKSSENDAIGSDSLENKQVSPVKPFGTNSSALQITPIDGLQGGPSTSGPCDTNRSGFLANQTLQGKAVTPKQLETSQKTSSNTLPNSNNELSGDETHENKFNQTLSHGSKSHRNFTEKHQLSAKTEVHGVSNTSSTSLQQGKPDLVEERDVKATFKPDKNAEELVKVADESVSKVLDWFKRSSGTEDRKHFSARSQDREPQEEVNISSRTAVPPAEQSGPSMDRKTEVTKEVTFGKIKQHNSISPTFISEDAHLIERMKPKKGEENEDQNYKSPTEIDCTRVQEVEHGQKIKQQNQKSSLMEHEEHKLPAQKYQSEKSIQEKRRIKEIRAFWERDKSVPSHKEREVSINANASGGGALKGLRDTEKIKPTAIYLPSGSGDQSKYTLRSYGLSCVSQASKNEHQNSYDLGPVHAHEKVERRASSDGEVPEYTELPEASNWQPRVGATLCFPESKDEKETLKQKAAAPYQQKPNIQVLSLKEKMNEKSKNQISDPSQFQSLRNFWDTGIKLQNNIDWEAVSLPNNASLIACEVKSKEDKGNNILSKPELIRQSQTPEREKTQKLDPVVHELPLRSPTLNVTHTQNTDTVQLDRKPVISKPQDKIGLSQQEVKDCTERNIVSLKEHHASLQLLQSPGDKDASKETAVGSEELNPVLMALKRSADRKMLSKSLEDIPSATSNKGKINNPKEELALSAEDVSTVPSQPDKLFTNPDKLKGLSKSIPSFLQEESDDKETDTASESSYSLGRIKKSPSSLTNLSSSSGMASLSSVSGSLMSIYSADFGNVDVKGNIQFGIDYVEQLKELHIFICQCRDLAVADVKRQRSDPYVKTYLLPEKYKLGKRKTSVKKKTFNPVYNEILRYKIEKDLLKNQSLNISVWHNDTFGRNSFLGEVELDLGTWDWNDKSNKQINWFPLQPRTSTMAVTLENRGEMKLALQYIPHPVGGKKTLSTGEVHIWVKECHDLPLLRSNRLNSFIKCTILPDTSRKSRQKTRTVSKTANPVFNHTMVYDGFRPEDLKEACIELTVWDHNKLANHFLGGLRIGLGTGKSYGTTVDWMDSTSDEAALWEKMMKSPNRWVEDTLPLRMLMVAKFKK
ncbi:synaptotagmin-like protein 2 [Dryobates pubescens]|uniref:synaptotagmin-like protein 2 n=1 Tax=Dryobates pubescens TaxID=118200 RepID=UPI0023BA194D|nr:synaptotagmin-like protein 2 [Dryobates pubescens]